MNNLKDTLENLQSKSGKIFGLAIQFLICLSLISFSLETLPQLSNSWKELLLIIEVATISIFTIEYILRVMVSSNKMKFIFSFYGLVDLFAILPFYITTGLDLRSLRAFRFLRVFLVFKLIKYISAINRINKAVLLIKEEIILFLVLTLILLFISSVGIYYFENPVQPEKFSSIFSGLWWSVGTLTTVGYGDIYPITVGGKIFTFFVLMIGLGIVAVPTGLFASALTKAREL